MDFTTLIREQRNQFSLFREPDGIDAVLKHLEMAIKHFNGARLGGDWDLFSDVIYRSNHVFEGILKEAYIVLADDVGGKKTPFEIENFFAAGKVFRPKVIDYFARYRTDWRNASTHDYRMDFDEQEAFLAIATVSAFCFVAIGQMLQKLAADRSASASKPLATPRDYLTLTATIVADLPGIIRPLLAGSVQPALSETVLQGAIAGLVGKLWTGGTVLSDTSVEYEGQTMRPDILWRAGDETLVIEVKATNDILRTVNGSDFREQLSRYAHATGASAAIGIVFPKIFLPNITPVLGTMSVHDAKIPTVIIYPVHA